MEVEHLRATEDVLAVLPAVERLHRERDHALARRSDLDELRTLEFYRRVIARHSERGELELTLLRFGGDLAAFDLSFLDGHARRSWDGRIATRWARYSPGHILASAVLSRAMAEPHVTEVDWMRGEEPYKLRMATYVTPRQHLWAWSSPLVRRVTELPREAKRAFAAARSSHPGLQRAWLRAKQLAIAAGPAADRLNRPGRRR